MSTLRRDISSGHDKSKCLRAIVGLFLILSFAASTFGETRLGGFLEYDNIVYLKNKTETKANARNQGILQLELFHKVHGEADIFGSVEIRNDQADPGRDRIYLDEAYINLYKGDFDIRLGKQIFAWGRADGFNPTDNLSAWDFSDALDTEDEKIGIISGQVSFYLGNWTLEGVLVPTFAKSALPAMDSRWWPEMPASIPNPAYPERGEPMLQARYVNASPVLPDESAKNTQYAVKASGLTAGWDFSVSWFDGFDDLPSIHTSTVIDSTDTAASVTFEPRYHRRRAIGADFATTFGSIGARGELAYYLTDDWDGKDPAIDDPYLQYVVGLDYTFRDVMPEKDLFVLLQWVQEVQVPDRNTVYRITDFNHVYRKTLMSKVDLSLGNYSKLLFQAVVNFETDDWWLRPGFEWSVADGLELDATLDLLDGPGDSFFGLLKDNRRLQLRAKYSF
ncbi:MAG: hypothetical protein GTO24_17340 [candidate division Zixibacteria bacterium]|nr:hypothetical protein [candidate division Zixibacteria bacterium]